jgi:hypothetical protein
MAPSITGTLVPATATFNRTTGAMWLTFADGSTTPVSESAHTHHDAARVLAALGAVRFSDWGLVATKSPMRQAHVEVRP